MAPRRIEPDPGQESVWDYPRPPRIAPSNEHVQVIFNGVVIADSHQAKRVLETSHPPTYYIPMDDICMEYLEGTPRSSMCEWKGRAHYYTVRVDDQTAPNAAWGYLDPIPRFAAIKDHLAFYPSKMEACYVDDEEVQAQESDFYGGWITSKVAGPFKGAPGTWGW